MGINNLMKSLKYLESSLTLKDDYAEELESLDTLESNAKVLLYLNGNRQRIINLLTDIARVREWIKQELECQAKSKRSELR